MAATLTTIVIDANDVDRLAEFWSAVLGRHQERDKDGDFVLAAPPGESVDVVIIAVPERKSPKNRVHIDLVPTGVDQREELERLLALGATRIDIGQGETSWIVLADPEGNEFCLLRPRQECARGPEAPS